jgi:hypothetical protein
MRKGRITIGIIRPVKECVAIAHEGRTTLAMQKRRKAECLANCSHVWIAPSAWHTPETSLRLTLTRSAPSSHPGAFAIPNGQTAYTGSESAGLESNYPEILSEREQASISLAKE